MKKQEGKISLAEAKRLSILKWKMLTKTNYDIDTLYDYPEETRTLLNQCGFCERWRIDDLLHPNCKSCEFAEANGFRCGINSNDSPFSKWVKARGKEELLAAKEVLKLIKSIPVKKTTKKAKI